MFECNKETLPMQFDNEQKKEKPGNKPNPKQCMTCCNIVPKSIYPNKYLIYNNKQYSLCVKCSKFETNIPVKDKTLIEFQDCRICCKQVKYESIFCNLCQHLIHPYCNGISKKELKILGNTDDNWYCMDCNFKIFPNQLFTTKTKNEIKLKKLNVVKEYITFNDCSVCCKTVSGNNTLSCNTCKHWIHKKCIGKFKNRTEYQNFLHYYSTKPWDCPICTSEMLPFILLDNNEFNLLLLDIYTKPLYLNKENIESVYIKLKDKNFFNIEDTDNFRQDKYLDDIDPDLNFFSNDTCNYTIDTDHIVNKSSNELAMMTFNIRSMKKNFNNFVHLLCQLNCKIHIICLTETWLKELDNINDFELDGYHTPQFQNRPDDISGGGVVTYIHKDIEIHKHVKNLSFVDEYNHCLATEIQLNNKNTLILNIYQSPNKLNESFLKTFENIVQKSKTKTCYILGDMNYNLINIDNHAPTNEYNNILTSTSFRPLITKPTRITETNETLIDHIWTNNLQNNMSKSHILLTDITDHLPCISIIQSTDIMIKGYKNITKRMINDTNRQKFSKQINEIKDVLLFQATNKAEPNIENRYNNYFDHISRVYNQCFPLKIKKVHSKTLSKPWITPKIQKLIDVKNRKFCLKNKNNTEINKMKYKIAKKEMQKAIDVERKNILMIC